MNNKNRIMKNPILSSIVVSCILYCSNVTAQTIKDDIYSSGKTQSVLVNKSVSTDKIDKKSTDTKCLVLGGMAIHPSQTSGFVMVGAVKTIGGYLKFKTDLNFDESFGSEGMSTDRRYFTGETQPGRYAAIGGLLWRVFSPVLLYGGLGYGSRWVNWKTVSGDIYCVDDISYKGVELETGLILKVKKLVFSGGVSVTSFKYMEANVGVGIMFGIPKPKIKAIRVKSSHGGKR